MRRLFLVLLWFLSTSIQAEEGADDSQDEEVEKPTVYFSLAYTGVCEDADLSSAKNTEFCIGGRAYGGLLYDVLEDSRWGNNHKHTEYVAAPLMRLSTPVSYGTEEPVVVSTLIELEADEIGTTTVQAFASITFKDWTLSAGRMEVGGIDQGNEYVTELGSDITEDYGNKDEEQNYLLLSYEMEDLAVIHLGYSARPESLSYEEQALSVDVQSVNGVIELKWERLVIAAEFETRHYYNSTQLAFAEVDPEEDEPIIQSPSDPVNEYSYGVGVAYHANDKVTIFGNAGWAKNSDETFTRTITDKSLNVGIDLAASEALGLTVGYESVEKESEERARLPDITNAYIAAKYTVGPGRVGLGYWWSDQKVANDEDNLASQLIAEIGVEF